MSFNCQNCKKHVSQNIPTAQVVTKTRSRTYVSYFDGRYPIQGVELAALSEEDKKSLRAKETQGTEIVKAIAVCPDCELALTGKCSFVAPEKKVSEKETSNTSRAETLKIPVEYVKLPKRSN